MNTADVCTTTIGFQFVRSGALSSRAIGWFGGGFYSHVDCVLDDGRLLGARSDFIKVRGIAYEPGVRIRPKDYETWQRRTLIRVPVTARQHELWMDFLTEQLGKPYDHTAIWGFAVGRDWREDDSWFCSELATRSIEVALLQRDLTLSPSKVSPGACSLVACAIGGFVMEDVGLGLPAAA